MSGTALATLADMGTYRGQLSHYTRVKNRLGVSTAPRPMVKATVLAIIPPAPRVRLPHEYLDIASSQKAPFSPANTIINEVCAKHRVSREEIMGRRREKMLVIARHEAFYRLSTETTMSLPHIGMRMGGKDHSTAINGIKKHKKRMAEAAMVVEVSSYFEF